MNPKKAKEELSNKIRELDEERKIGMSAKEMADTPYFKQLEELYKKEIEAFYEIKKLTPYLDVTKTHYVKTGDGKIKKITGEEYLRSLIAQEIEVMTKKDLLSMVHNDIRNGVEASKELETYKNKLNR